MSRGNLFLIFVLVSPSWEICCSQRGVTSIDPVIERKVDSLLALMTVEEKVGQLNQLAGQWDENARRVILTDEQRNLMKRGLVGSFLNVTGSELTREFQRIAVNESRLHIPLIFALDVIHGLRTTFPIPLAEASSWDPEAAEMSARIAAREASAFGINWTFAPMVDIARDPRWGRIAEGSGEDPYLGSMMAAARVRGFQGSGFHDSTSLVACAKHFAAYGAAEAGRDYNTVDISEQTLRDIYLPPFRAAVDAGVGTLMSAFNEIAGVPSTANHKLLTTILRSEWGFKGFVVSDWEAVEELQEHGIAGTPGEAALKAITAGVDMDMATQLYIKHLPEMVESGALSMGALNEAVRRVLRVKFALGLFENPYRNCHPELENEVVVTAQSRGAARKIAGESIVLLKNANALLPLKKDIRTLAVIGSLANSKVDPLGPWAGFFGRPEDVVTVLEGIKAKVSANTQILYARGCESRFSDTTGFGEAVRAAQGADAIVLVVGETRDMSGEASSRSDIGLPGVQEELVKRVYAAGHPLVLVLMNGRPLTIAWEAANIPAIIESWFLGVETGNAVASVLFGDLNPSGKLPVSFPRTVGQIPIYYNHKNTGRPFVEKEKYTSKFLDLPNTPLFPFGYGMSYTSFSYSNLRVMSLKVRKHESVTVSIEVKNTGAQAGDDVVQLYVHDDVASNTRPVKELNGFRRITLNPEESKTVEFTVDTDRLGFHNSDMKYVVEPGKFKVFIGGNSVDCLEGSFELTE